MTKLIQIFKMDRIYKKFSTMKEATTYVHSLSNPSKMDTCGYSISALDCNMGGLLFNVKGSVCENCYARKGRYVFESCQNALNKRLDKIKNEPLWVDAMIYIMKNQKSVVSSGVFRWHDSGDIQGLEHLDKIVRIAIATPDIK